MPTSARTHRAQGRSPIKSHASNEDRRDSASRRGYDRKWQRLRRWFLARHPVCQECECHGRAEAATEVHHIAPLSDGGSRLREENLQALCKSCHSRKTKGQNP